MLVVAAPNQQAFDGAAGGNAAAQQARRKDARVVDHQEVAGRQAVGQLREAAVRDGARYPIEVKQPRRASVGGRLLGDQAGRQVEVEVADVHPQKQSLAELFQRSNRHSGAGPLW